MSIQFIVKTMVAWMQQGEQNVQVRFCNTYPGTGLVNVCQGYALAYKQVMQGV